MHEFYTQCEKKASRRDEEEIVFSRFLIARAKPPLTSAIKREQRSAVY